MLTPLRHLALAILSAALAQTLCPRAMAGPRLDQLQLIGTHNSYHIAPHPALDALIRSHNPDAANSLAYTHAPLRRQLEDLGIRQIELDLYADPKGGLFANPSGPRLASDPNLGPIPTPDPAVMQVPGAKILHLPDFDFQSTVPTLRAALEEVRDWSFDNPDHVPVFILLELKSEAAPGGETRPLEWNQELLDALELEVLAVLPREHIIAPDDVRGAHPSLRQAVQANGWPLLAHARGRVVFLLDNTDAVRDVYLSRSSTLAGRLFFVSVEPRHPAAAWFKINDPVADFDRIQDLVRRGFLVRTRADDGTREARFQDVQRREKAFASGAQLISTDYPEPQPSWGPYKVRFPDGIVARANPVSAPAIDPALNLEDLALSGLEPFDPFELILLNERSRRFHDARRLAEASRDYQRLLELDPPATPTPAQMERIRELAPVLRTVPTEPFRLAQVVAIHHPGQPLIAYHLFWDDDIDFPDDNDPVDHEVVWVQYEPVSGRALRTFSYFHGRIQESGQPDDRPAFAVEWGKHGSLPMDRFGSVVEPPSLKDHWRRLSTTGIRQAHHPLARRWPKKFNGDWDAYRAFTGRIDIRDHLDRQADDPLAWTSLWANAVLDQHALRRNFAPKTEWPE